MLSNLQHIKNRDGDMTIIAFLPPESPPTYR